MIIGLHGKMQSGKDTCGNFLTERLGFKRLAFADAVRTALWNLNPIVDIAVEKEYGHTEDYNLHLAKIKLRVQDIVSKYGWDKAKVDYPEIRKLMQLVGTESGRDIHGQDCWTNIVKRQIEANPKQDYVITDLRFPNEKVLVEELGGFVVHIVRDGQTSDSTHASEQVLENIPYKIMNNGNVAELEGGVHMLYNHLTSEKKNSPLTVSCYIPCIEKSLDNAVSV